MPSLDLTQTLLGARQLRVAVIPVGGIEEVCDSLLSYRTLFVLSEHASRRAASAVTRPW